MLKTATGNGNSADLLLELTKAPNSFSLNTAKFFTNSGILYDEKKDNSSFIAAFDNALGLLVSGGPFLSFLSFVCMGNR